MHKMHAYVQYTAHVQDHTAEGVLSGASYAHGKAMNSDLTLAISCILEMAFE